MIVVKEGESLYRQRHVGITQDEFREGLVAAIAQIQSMEQKSRDIITDALNVRVDLGSEETREVVQGAFNLTEENATEVLTLAGGKYGPNKLGVSDAVTEIAQRYSLERRIELEKMAGEYLRAAA
jgi:hypothetical protein